MELIKNLEWRYATKKFDISKKVISVDLEKIKDAIRLSASSFGLQAYTVLVIKDPEIRRKLQVASCNQPQISDCSHLFVFCNYIEIGDKVVDDFIQLKANALNLNVADLSSTGNYLKGALSKRTEDQLKIWTSKQTYIALGNLLAATAELGIDACPMEGFEFEKYNEILGLNEKGLNASVIAAVGYRSSDDQAQFAPKVRKSKEILFEEI